MLVGGENYEITIGLNSFHAEVCDFEIDFYKHNECLIIKRNSTTILEIDGFFVKSISGVSVRNKGMYFTIKSADFVLTYDFLRFIRFRTEHGWIVVEI